jgi:hypothetical protein
VNNYHDFWAEIQLRSAVVAICIVLLVTSLLFDVAFLSPISIGLTIASLIVVAYLLVYEIALIKWNARLTKLRMKIQGLSGEDRERLLKVSRQGREQGMLGMGNLFIPTAFILLAAAATAQLTSSVRMVLAISAPALYVLWLFSVQLSTRLMDDVDAHIRLLAKDGAGEVLHDFYGDRHGHGRMMKCRRNHWLFYVPLLTIAASMIIQSIPKCP